MAAEDYYKKHLEDAPKTPYGIETDDIDSGKRKTGNTCQYWVKGLSSVCKYWNPGDPGNCTHDQKNEKDQKIYPSGWNGSRCDYLGRRFNCDKYEASGEDDLNQYICIAPNPFISGLTRDTDDGKAAVAMTLAGQEARGIDRYVWGYNADGDFVGKCDGCGLGKGSDGHGLSCSSPQMEELPVVCNYYRPWHMGFGAKEPKTTDITRAKVDKKTGRIVGDEREEMRTRLPLSFKVYNLRAKLQKCAYWSKDVGSEFELSDDDGEVILPDYEYSEAWCTNPDEMVTPYHTQTTFSGADMFLVNVWAEAGCIMCNGARGNCPGYTGRWVYCLDDKLEKGDNVSAQQVLELRFWMMDWASQKEYDDVFKKPPNKDDPSTSFIYTYGKWETVTSNPYESILTGKKVGLCVPSHRREFSSEYIQTEGLTYENSRGTAAPNQERVRFPSLIRDIEDVSTSPLNITYPYTTKDPFDYSLNPICGNQSKTPCIKKYYSIDGDEIRVVGSTIVGKTVYAFNLNLVNKSLISPEAQYAFDHLVYYGNVLNIETFEDRQRSNESAVFLKEDINRQFLLCNSTSDSEYGVFVVGPLKLNYSESNDLVVMVEMDDGWVYRKRTVYSQWHGGVIKQEKFTHEYESEEDDHYVDQGYNRFVPQASVEFSTDTFVAEGGFEDYQPETTFLDLVPISNEIVYNSIGATHNNVNYCIHKVSKTGISISRWLRVGLAGYLWLEIDDLDLNYQFEWGIDKVVVTVIRNEGEEDETEEQIEMEAVGIDQNNIPPNCCLVKPKDGSKYGFHSDNCEVVVDYWYKELSNDTSGEVVWPDFDSGYNFIESTINININDKRISNIDRETVAVLAKFFDEDFRLISTMATKLCVDIVSVLCRDVEIFYNWTGNSIIYDLFPRSGFLRIDQDGPFFSRAVDSKEVSSVAPCGDHEWGAFSYTGPVWYPFDGCETTDWYDVFTGPDWCILPHEDTPRNDYRFRGPELNVAEMAEPHASAWDCWDDWAMSYSTLKEASVRFNGYIRKRGRVDLLYYNAMTWAEPNFGNVLREYTERFRSIDCSSYLSLKTGIPVVKKAWMPLVMDDTCFYFDFNSVSNSGEVINFVNPLNFLQAEKEEKLNPTGNTCQYWVNGLAAVCKYWNPGDPGNCTHDQKDEKDQKIYPSGWNGSRCDYLGRRFNCDKYEASGEDDLNQYSRIAFSDIFETTNTILASYPGPIKEGSGNFSYVSYYKLKEISGSQVMWAWQEKWKDIERCVVDCEPLNFLLAEKPDYIYSIDKEEHRFITSEGENNLRFIAPTIADDGTVEEYPGVSVGNGPTRYFDFLDFTWEEYSSDDDTLVNWCSKDGSSEGSGSSIYSVTTVFGAWIHSESGTYPDYYNMIYDADATKVVSEAENDDRKILISEDVLLGTKEEYVYNRGVVAKIYANRLRYMPYNEIEISASIISSYENDIESFRGEGGYFWTNHTGEKTDIKLSCSWDDGDKCISKVVIKGTRGVYVGEDATYHIHKPGISIYDGDDSRKLKEVNSDYLTLAETERIALGRWEEEIDLEVKPPRMSTERPSLITIHLSNFVTDASSINITSVELYEAQYVSSVEAVTIWERKYIVSGRNVGGDLDLDGTTKVLSYEQDWDNAGVYFNSTIATAHGYGDKISTKNKMRSVYGDEEKDDSESVPAVTDEDVIEAEQDLQMELYQTAYSLDTSDTITYSIIPHPAMQTFFNDVGVAGSIGGTCSFKSEKLKWENHFLFGVYESHVLWFPQGHLYKWSKEARAARCYIVDTLHDIMTYSFVHVHSGAVEDTAGAIVAWYKLRPAYMKSKWDKEFIQGGGAHEKLGDGIDSHATPYAV